MSLTKMLDKNTVPAAKGIGTKKAVDKAVKEGLGQHQAHVRLVALEGLKTRLTHLDRLSKVMLDIEAKLLKGALTEDDMVKNYCLFLLNQATTVSHIKDLAEILKTQPGVKVPDQVKKRAMAICEALAALCED